MSNENQPVDLGSDAKSIKRQIMDRILDNLAVLKNAETGFRDIRRESDPLAQVKIKPSLLIYDGTEVETGKDNIGRTYEFTVSLEMHFSSQRNLGEEKDRLVPLVQKILEDDLQLNGLCNVVAGGEEEPFISELGKPDGGVTVRYVVRYRRKRGDPYSTY
jgi:hypothetical protein